jgi:3-hydroxyacyl-[acyl-carrier-protein] dehydratase
MTPQHYQTRFRIDNDHPALPGHFPQRPVIPGVVLLDRVAAALAQWRGQRIAALPQVKFLAPLLPEQDAELSLHDDGKSIRFDISHGTVSVASGIVHTVAIERSADEIVT